MATDPLAPARPPGPKRSRGATFNPDNRFRDATRVAVDDGWSHAPDPEIGEPSRQVRRAELATTVSRLLTLIEAAKPELAKRWQAAKININDVAPSHLSYPAVSRAVASGVMPLTDGNFELLRTVSGGEIIAIIGRLEALARP